MFFYWLILLRVLAFMGAVVPTPDRDLAESIAWRIYREPPLFRDDKERTAALLVAIAFRESSLQNDIAGDFECKRWETYCPTAANGVQALPCAPAVCVEVDFDKPTSFCAFQIHLPGGATTHEGWTGADLRADPDKCALVAYRMLESSLGDCREEPDDEKLAGYARGNCRDKKGKQLSRDRFWLGRDILARAAP